MRLSFIVLVLGLAAGAAAAPPAPAPSPSPAAPEAALQGLEFRNIGPALMGGRIDDFAVLEDDPSTFYVATAAGGLWKTQNAGTTFEPIFDDQPVSSIGDVTLAPSDPSIVYVGTGEPNNRQSSSWGNGVYRSLDGGQTWTHLGLAETHHIGRIAVHPRNPDVAYVAALGRLWGPQQGARPLPDRGRRAHLDAEQVRGRGHGRRGRGHRPAEPAHPLRRVLPAPPLYPCGARRRW